ncbi:MAG TPA: S1 RNA-binding domain-containing protein, partial [bacterium]|nr:S1 RNA-binding domain-containing protein [bacterium]
LEELVGQTFLAKIIELRGRQDAVLSRREYLEEERDRRRKETLGLLQEGALVRGVVKNLTDFGAFVDLGGIDGLLHINDMSWQHVTRPEDVVAVNQEVEVLILQIDGERISLGLKQKTEDPWGDVLDRYPIGAVVSGQITSLTKYGAFVELEPGVEGLIHISEMSWTHRIKHPSDVFNIGDMVAAQILKVDDANKRISLGYKQTQDNPWALAEVKYPVNSTVEGEVVGLTDFGAFVRLEDGVDGMIHVSDMSWTKKIKHPSEVLKEGDAVQAVVLEVNGEQKRISLGLKQVEPDPWSRAKKRYRLGNHAEGTVVKVTDFGAFVELEEGIEGLIHISEISDRRVDHPEDMLKVGDRIHAKVIKSDSKNRKIGLSIREYQNDMERQEVQKYMDSGEESLGTMGDLISSALKRYDMQAEKEAQKASQKADETSEEAAPQDIEPTVEVVPEPAAETAPEPETEPTEQPVSEQVVEPVEEDKSVEETTTPEETESENRATPTE